MSVREDFVVLADQGGVPVRELCRRFDISPPTAYKWLHRYRKAGTDGLRDLPRRPGSSPFRCSDELEAAVLELRRNHPAWGGRKLRARLLAKGRTDVPSASTITEILRRHGMLNASKDQFHGPWQRFERAEPNELWQVDFKGDFAVGAQRCYPLTMLDDHSRFALTIHACSDQKASTVQEQFCDVFRIYGLPERVLMDNGPPWGDAGNQPYTNLVVWLMRLGVETMHGRPRHPQTQGKEERFHRSLQAEVLHNRIFHTLAECQREFEIWRHIYNIERPHDSLDLVPPITRYRPSPRSFPELLPDLEYGPDDRVRKVQQNGAIYFEGREYRINKAFRGQYMALRPTRNEDCFDVYFCRQRVSTLDLQHPHSSPKSVNHVSEHV